MQLVLAEILNYDLGVMLQAAYSLLMNIISTGLVVVILNKSIVEFHSHRHHHRSGLYDVAAAVHGTYKPQPEGHANSPHHYDRALPCLALKACTPHARSLTEENVTHKITYA